MVILIFVLHLQTFVFFTFKLLQFFVTSCASEFVRFFLNLWICKIYCVYFFVSLFQGFCILFVKFLVFVKFYVLLSTRLVQELLACNYHGILKFHAHLSPLFSFFSKSLLFSLSIFLLLKGSRLLSTTTCVSIVVTFLNLTCLYVLATWASYFVEESFIKK